MNLQKINGIKITFIVCFVLVLSVTSTYGQHSENYTIKASKISCGSTPQQSASSYNASSMIGQSASGQEKSDTNFLLTSGFLSIYHQLQTDVDMSEDQTLPQIFRLYHNYPNPFNPETVIRYDLPQPTEVILTVYNSLGQKVKTLVDREQIAGTHTVTWDGLNDNGVRVVSGVYFFQLHAGDYIKTRKMVVVR
jgi:hypothetical protein